MILPLAIFLFILAVVLLCIGFAHAFLASRQKQQIRTMLRRAESEAGKQRLDLITTEVPQDPLDQRLRAIPVLQGLGAMLEQSGMEWKLAKFLTLTLTAAIAGSFAGFVLPGFSRSFGTALLAGLLAGLLPLFMVRRKRAKRLAKFEEQFPEALNFLSRSMRAG